MKSHQQASNTLLETICPAVMDDKLKNKIISSAILAHKSIGARHYSLLILELMNVQMSQFFLKLVFFGHLAKQV